ncbi:MAG: hypothetical protein AAGI03_05145 [Pseudomonadota bacterium]
MATFVVAADHQLVTRTFYVGQVWRPARRQDAVIGSRANWRTALHLVDDYYGRLFHTNGQPYHYDEINDVFDDPRNRWMGYFLEADEAADYPARFCIKLERLRLIELYCRLVDDQDWQ